MKKTILSFTIIFALCGWTSVFAQDNQTIFKNKGIYRSGGYAALSNKFTKIDGRFANMPELYGGWFINQRFLIGVSGAATTNFIRVPELEQNFPARKMTYMYGQFGLMTEYVIASTRKVHFTANLLTGAGFTLQYDRREVDDWDWDDWDDRHDDDDAKCFFVMEPGVQVEFNLLKWMRFSPGVSYRKAFNAKGNGLTDSDLSNISYNVTFKFGRF
ncbi:hypothetical protein LZD49_06055 [Dyadobacter sp. CY261]|uniref:hypothetical protein n=1 Tax=Dyadobacter sp. CY261 TaxID=2907203 RepID=UPI001F40A312|nr:hypothetical protein [Dyadobacter sp. CY261]MCF0070026.1 hypothetical protein [Dyadobacter sp. CY261]